ncbi:hypothetical protein JCM8208_007684 [Rhodotorula glutinis]
MDTKILISSSTSSPSTSPQLLDTIFTLSCRATCNQSSTRKPVCRRLLPFQRVQLYRRVEIRKYKALKLFHRTVMASSTCADLVRHLELSWLDQNVVEAADGGAARHAGQSDDGDDRKMVTPVAFAALVPRLSRLESLTTDDLDPALLNVAFLDEEASRSLSSLKAVVLSRQDELLVPEECDVGDWVRRLSCLPRLVDLVLRIDQQILPVMPAPPTFPHLARLVVKTGPMWSRATWNGVALDKLAPHLVELELEGYDLDWFAAALATAPVGLRILSLINSMDITPGEPVADVPVNDVLSRFKNLEQLYLGHGALDLFESSGLTALLALDKLQYLTFADTDLLTDDFLLALLADPSKLPRLVTLELDHVYSERGRTINAMHGKLPAYKHRHCHPHWPMWGEWRAPVWPVGCSESGLAAVVQAAEARGILVKGWAYDALLWRDAFEAEWRTALLALGDMTGNYRRARPVLGNAVVDAHILARARASVEGGEGGEGGEA